MQLPLAAVLRFTRPHSTAREGRGGGFHGDLQLPRVLGVDRQRLEQLHVDERAVGEPLGERGSCELDEAGGRQHCGTLHHVVAQEAEVIAVERGLPVHRVGLRSRTQGVTEQCVPTIALSAVRRRLVPVALTLPRVAGQHHVRRGRSRDRRPVHVGARLEQRAERGEHRRHLRFAAAHGRQHRRTRFQVVDDLVDRGQQDGVRAQLHEHRRALDGELGDRITEQHRLAQVGGPVVGVERRAVEHATSHGGPERDGGGAWGQRGERRAQIVEQRVDLRAVRRDVDLHRPAEHVGGLQSREHRLQRDGITGEHRGPRAVADRDRERRFESGDRRRRLGQRQVDERHRTLPADAPQERAAPADDRRCVSEAQRAGYMRGRHFPHAVPDHGVGRDAPRCPQRGQRHLDGEQQWLHHVDVVEARPLVGGEHLDRRPPRLRTNGVVALGHRGGECRLISQQFARHAWPLRTLPGEHEHDLRHRVQRIGAPRVERRQRATQRLAQFLGIGAHRGESLGEVGASGGRCRAQIRDGRPGHCERIGVPPGQLAQRVAVRGRDRQHGRTARCLRCIATSGRWRLFEHHVRVGAGDAVGTHATASRTVDRRPRLVLGGDAHTELAPRDVGVRLLEVERSRDLAVLQCERQLGQTSSTGSPLGVADVRLDGTDDALVGPVPVHSDHRAEGRQFDRIAGRGTGAVRLHVLHAPWVDTGQPVGASQHLLLAGLTRATEQATGAAVVGDGAAAHHRIDVVARLLRGAQPLERDHHRAVAAHVTVRGGIAELAATVGGHHPRLRVGDGDERLDDQVHTTGEGKVALPVAQPLRCEVHRDERRRARGVDGDARPEQVEEVGEPSGGGVATGAGGGVEVDALPVGEHARLVLVGPHAHVDAGVGAGDRFTSDAGIFQRFPRGLQQQALLRVESLRLARGHLEEACVEAVDAVDEPAPLAHDVPRCGGALVVEPVEVEATLRDGRDRVAAFAQQLPQRARVDHPAWEPAPDAHDGDGFRRGHDASGTYEPEGERASAALQ